MKHLPWILCGILIIILCWQSGCAYNGAIHREYVNGELVRQYEIGQLHFLYFSDKRSIELNLDGIADLTIGRSIQYSDPNSIRAIAKVVVETVVGL